MEGRKKEIMMKGRKMERKNILRAGRKDERKMKGITEGRN